MKLILTPLAIAEECFLQEALMWAAFHRYPKSEINPYVYTKEMRFDPNMQEEFEPNIPYWDIVESEEAVRVGLPPNPEWDAYYDDEQTYTLSDPSTIERLLKLDIEESEKDKLRAELVKTKKQAKLQAEWDNEYNIYMELIESKFFVALREGKIRAIGRKLPHHNLKKAIKILDKNQEGWSWSDLEHEEIPSDFWRQDGIDWKESNAKNDKICYFHICVTTEHILAVFPPPIAEEPKSVSLIAGQYVLDKSQANHIKKSGRRGRPALDWDSFFLEIADRVKNDNLPEKQEAFIAEMQAWCLKNWGHDVGRSTILQKISPYYKKYVTK